jgi:hypothetical protein
VLGKVLDGSAMSSDEVILDVGFIPLGNLRHRENTKKSAQPQCSLIH